jgi:radical SAM methylthiotransferase, MiaB/RimO family
MITDIDGVDIVCGNYNKLMIIDPIIELINKKAKSDKPVIIEKTFQPDDNFESMEIERFGRTRAYIKIQDGCNSNCAYCIIPKVRGNIRMKPADDVIREACQLVRHGCKEIVLIGIETSSYKNLTGLVGELQKLDGLERIRLGSLDPSYMRPSVTDELMSHSKFTPHFHLSMQSGSDKVLRAMRRKYNTSTALRNIEYIKSVNGDVNFTTDIMTGFPDETEADFNDTVNFAKIVEFLHIHIFTYSIRPGTDAAVMLNQVPEPEKIRRASHLAEVQENIKRSIYKKSIAKQLSVLVETYDGQTAFGHTPNFLEVEILSKIDIKDKIVTVNPIRINDTGTKLIGEII